MQYAKGIFSYTVFRLWCKFCKRTFRIRPYKIHLYTNTPSPFYAFKCKLCKNINTKPANKRAMVILIENGAIHELDPPPEHLTAIDSPPLTLEDLAHFHNILKREEIRIVEQVRKLGRKNGSNKDKKQ